MTKTSLTLYLLLSIALTTNVQVLWGQSRLAAFKINKRLGRGINIGNTFEAPTETAWGNPWRSSYFKIISELGFRHVRVPVRWETPERSMPSSPYTINAAFLSRMKEVVDAALKNKLHIIINMHHHELLYENPSSQKERFLSQWSQIARYFKNYPDSLLFEVLNEPHGNLGASMWNEYFASALAEIRKTNPTRVVLMDVAEYGGLSALSKLVLPADEYIIVSPHYYNPFPFATQGAAWVSGADQWVGTRWYDTEGERQTVASEFSYALHFSEINHVPLHVGEFGAYNKADMESRTRWTTFLSRWFEEHNMSWAYWEFSAGFGIYNPDTRQQVPALVDALLHNKKPVPIPVSATPLYTSNFSKGTDGWYLFSPVGGAAGSLSVSGNKANVTISNGGTEPWHLLLIKDNISLKSGGLYKVTFVVQSKTDRSINFYAAKASPPWTSYSSTIALTVGAKPVTYTSTFVMPGPTDPAARLVINLGLSTSSVVISSVKVEALSL